AGIGESDGGSAAAAADMADEDDLGEFEELGGSGVEIAERDMAGAGDVAAVPLPVFTHVYDDRLGAAAAGLGVVDLFGLREVVHLYPQNSSAGGARMGNNAASRPP